MTIWCRGVRGATTCDENSREAILTATREMLQLLIAANGLRPEDLASAIFTTTPDLNAEFPAVAEASKELQDKVRAKWRSLLGD